MHIRRFTLWCLVGGVSSWTAAASGTPPPGEVVVVDQTVDAGGRTERDRVTQAGDRLRLSHEVAMSFDDNTYRFDVRVDLRAGPPLVTESAEAKVSRDGKLAMSGRVTVTGRKVTWTCTSHEGDPRRPPGSAFDGSFEVPDGATLLLQPALPTLAPRLLAKPGELAVHYVEFPDDWHAPELVEPKRGYRLVRSAADSKGGFTIALVDGEGRRRLELVYDARGRCVALGGGGIPVPVKHAEP